MPKVTLLSDPGTDFTFIHPKGTIIFHGGTPIHVSDAVADLVRPKMRFDKTMFDIEEKASKAPKAGTGDGKEDDEETKKTVNDPQDGNAGNDATGQDKDDSHVTNAVTDPTATEPSAHTDEVAASQTDPLPESEQNVKVDTPTTLPKTVRTRNRGNGAKAKARQQSLE